ncbi:hypothetical protein ACQKLP_18160 [Chitinophaga sp. NPDC101104]|uniref:hypothetical protein n=1 Tax=Chitinophaga sp. NPDC101104 TaxID=3390561 RepID=UPI003D06B0DF
MKIFIIAIMLVATFLASKGQGPHYEMVGIYKSTISRACIVLYKIDSRYRARAYEDFAAVRKYVYTGAPLSRLPGDKAQLDFSVDYSETAFENLHNKDDMIKFSVPPKSRYNQAVLDFFARAGTSFKPM